ncbi:hypothetical protein BCR43DRAFT_488772 [Syncephalastrum racemosum]|uniref:Uncharacterized protein n=1 Tax=Syncephalastrum racemosum TaxID=13706 RepID=A0A1X2HJ41_SYNRA|nr:hypothetical protein BCR43DRAFT_488772 [Syncephalastrum racemosum]
MVLHDDARAPLLSRSRISDGDQRSTRSRSSTGSQGSESQAGRASQTDYGSGIYRYPLYLQPGQFTSLEKLMFFVSSILLILLCVFIGLYARSSLEDTLPKPVPSPTSPALPTLPAEPYCIEPSCILTAAHILQDIDAGVDPCNDFYAYTCANWAETHMLAEGEAETSVVTAAQETIQQQLHRILLNGIPSHSKGLPPPDHILDQQLFDKLKTFYDACLDETSIDERGLTPLYPVFHEIRRHVPLGYRMPPTFVDDVSQITRYLADRGIDALFSMRVEIDPADATLARPAILPGEHSLPTELYNDPEALALYSSTIAQLLEIVFQADTSDTFGWRSWSPVATARRIVEFETQLVKASASTASQTVHRWTLDDLKASAPGINWSLILPTDTPVDIVLVPHADYVIQLSEDILAHTNPRTLHMYLVWRALWRYADALGETFSAPRREFEQMLKHAKPAKPQRWQYCLAKADDVFGYLLGRYYKQAVPSRTEQARSLVSHVTQAMRDRVQSLDWVDAADTPIFLEKLRRLELELEPMTQPNLDSTIDLTEFYEEVVVKDGFFTAVLTSGQRRVRQDRRRLDHPVEKSAWNHVLPQEVTLAYHPALNKMTIPTAMLQHPFYTDVDYLSYGALGTLTGHALMPLLRGDYDAHGRRALWWSNATQAGFEERLACYNTTHNELVAKDQASLVFALDAWRRAPKDAPRLPGLDAWTREQLFFIQFARMHCRKPSFATRINTALQYSPAFAQAFSCPSNSPMSAVKRCQVW